MCVAVVEPSNMSAAFCLLHPFVCEQIITFFRKFTVEHGLLSPLPL